jgi:hypothetical protein
MKNLDLDNTQYLDESFSGFSGSDYKERRNLVADLNNQLVDLKKQRLAFPPNCGIGSNPICKSLDSRIFTTNNQLISAKSELAKIPQSVIDAVNRQEALESQLAIENERKLQEAELLALNNQSNKSQEDIDKARAIAKLLEDKRKGINQDITSGKGVTPNSVRTKSEDVLTEEGKTFGMNSILFYSIVGVSALVIGFFTFKIIKKQ